MHAHCTHVICYFLSSFFFKGLPISTNSRKRSIPPCKYQACQTDMEVDTNPILQASPPPPRYRCKCIETHRMCSRVAAGALPMPCKCIATGSKCFQSGRTSCQHGPGQALCSRLPCLVQCRGGHSVAGCFCFISTYLDFWNLLL